MSVSTWFPKKFAGMLLCCLCLEPSASAYIRNMTGAAVPIYRTDASAIHFSVHTSFAAGYLNANGQPAITASSNPLFALAAATGAWSSVASAMVAFAPFGTTSAEPNSSDGLNIVTAEDTAEIRSVVGQALAVTYISYTSAGAITDTDMMLNPEIMVGSTHMPFSTDHEVNTFDLEGTLTHEMGHALGSNHTGILSATMYQSALPIGSYSPVADSTMQATLSPDDIAFVTSVYPAPIASSLFGSVSGSVHFTNGQPVKGALIVAVDALHGYMIGGLTNFTDGSYNIAMVPAGSYMVYAQPLDGPVLPGNLYLPSGAAPATSFQTAFAGGNSAPSNFAVTAGSNTGANITVSTAASGMHIDMLGVGTAGGGNWVYSDVLTSAAGQPREIYIWGTGIDSTITAGQIRILTPGVKMRAGTLASDPNSEENGETPIHFTVDVLPSLARVPVDIVITKGQDATANSGGLLIRPGRDFDQDDRPDLIWQDPVSGTSQLWLMGGAQGATATEYAGLTGTTTLRIVGVADLNQDGAPDLIWQDPATGASSVWFMGGALGNTVIGTATLSNANAWRIAGVADMDGDGHPDLIWQDPASGLSQVWFLGGSNGTTRISYASLSGANAWRIAGIADFDRDGHPDLLWQDPASGTSAVWLMGGAQGTSLLSSITFSGPNAWRIATIADLDGRVDVVWQDPASGSSAVWFLGGSQGTTLLSSTTLTGSNTWRIAGH